MRATAFLDRFRRMELAGSPLELFADDPEGFDAAITDAPEALAESVETAAARVEGRVADLIHGSFASAACDASGAVVEADASFRAWLEGLDPLGSVVRRVRAGEPHLSVLVADGGGRPVALAAGGSEAVANWPLSVAVRAALQGGRASHAVVAFRPDQTGWARIARAHGWTPSETRLVAALAQEGELRAAAERTGIAYETARKQIAAVMAKCGARRQTDLVREAMRLAAGDMRAPANVDRLFADMFDLTLRQARIARGIALGGTRGAVAKAMRISEHAVKADLKIVYVACGVEAAVDLSRIVAEVDALAGLATACDVAVTIGQTANEPLRLVPRTWADGRIAVADHGPANGFPVMIFQVITMGRAMSPRFIAALQAAGLRPIVFDRSGFGLTDHVAGDPYETAARDLADVLDAIGVARVVLVGRGFSNGTVTVAGLVPERVLGGLLVGPEPPASLDRIRSGMMGVGKRLFFDHPGMAAGFARLLAHRTNSTSITRMVRESVATSPVDCAALDDPVEMATMVRGCRQCALGMQGFLTELLTHGANPKLPVLKNGGDWAIAYGAADPVYDFAPAADYWRTALPGMRLLPIEDGGRYLHMTHAGTMAAICGEIADRFR